MVKPKTAKSIKAIKSNEFADKDHVFLESLPAVKKRKSVTSKTTISKDVGEVAKKEKTSRYPTDYILLNL